MKKIILTLFLLVFSCPSYAEVVQCTTSINGEIRSLNYHDDDYFLNKNYSWREKIFHGRGNITCPAFVTLRYLIPDLSDRERSVFCLKYDKELETYTGFVNDDRDAYLVCKKPKKSFCERVNATKETAIALAGLAAGTVGGAGTAASAAGVTAVAHSSGAVILTGTSGYIAGTLGGIGATSLAIVTAPATIAATAVSVVTVGGAVYFCRDKDSDNSSK